MVANIEICLVLYDLFYTDIPHVLVLLESVNWCSNSPEGGLWFFFFLSDNLSSIIKGPIFMILLDSSLFISIWPRICLIPCWE